MRRGRTTRMGKRRLATAAVLLAAAILTLPASASAFEPLVQFGGPGPGGAGQLQGNAGIGVDGSGNVYVGELANRISEFSTGGDFKLAFGYNVIPGGGTGFEVCTMATTCQTATSGSAAGQFLSPYDVAANTAGDRLYVPEAGNNRVSQFNATPDFVNAWGFDVIPGGGAGFEVCTTATTCKAGVGGIGQGQLGNPFSTAIGPSGDVYVSDGTGRAQEFTADGSFVRTYGSNGSGPGNIGGTAQGVGVDASGNVYVSDQSNSRVDVFGPTGNFLRAWGFNVIPAAPSGFQVCTTVTNCQSGTSGPGAGQFSSQTDLAVGPGGEIYVADSGNYRVSQFTGAGDFTRAFGYDVVPGGSTGFEICTTATGCKAGAPGSGFGQLGSAFGVAVDCRGAVYVSDQSNSRIVKYGEPGAAPPPCPVPAAEKPSNAFSFGKVKLNKKKGTATLTVNLPGAGVITLTGKGVKAVKRAGGRGQARLAKAVTGPGAVKLAIKPKGKTKKTLSKKGKVKVKVTVTFTPTGGDANAQLKKIKLRKTLR
jgi:NHL repeat